jgi:hypothetical protein
MSSLMLDHGLSLASTRTGRQAASFTTSRCSVPVANQVRVSHQAMRRLAAHVSKNTIDLPCRKTERTKTRRPRS